jgi:hypothetical protein
MADKNFTDEASAASFCNSFMTDAILTAADESSDGFNWSDFFYGLSIPVAPLYGFEEN